MFKEKVTQHNKEKFLKSMPEWYRELMASKGRYKFKEERGKNE